MPPLLRFIIALCASCILNAGEVETVGSSGDPSTMVLTGVRAFREQDVRRAVAGDLPLLLARRPEASRAEWLRLLEDGIRLGYRQAGFRDVAVAATVADGRTRVAVEEGPRTSCGEVRLPGVPPEIAAIARAALGERRNPQAGMFEFDTAPVLDEAMWAAGRPVDWNRDERYAERIEAALRRAGLVGGRISATVSAADSTATLTLGLAEVPVPVRLGRVVVAGLGEADGERLRRWLDLPADAPATRALEEAVNARLRNSASFIEARAVWEDQAWNPQAMLKRVTMDEFNDAVRQEAIAMSRRVAERGRADLLITARPVPQAAMPWEDASRARTTVLASRAMLMQRLADGAELVATTSLSGSRLRVVWSPAHGFAWLQDGEAGTALAVGDGWLATRRGGRQLRARMSVPHLSVSIGPSQDGDQDQTQFALTGSCKVGPLPRVQLDLLPAGVVSFVMRIGRDHRPVESWDGNILVLAYADAGYELRCDPAIGPSLLIAMPQQAPIAIALQEGVWRREVAPLLAGGGIPERHPVGTVLGEALAAIREAVPEAAGMPGLGWITAVAGSGAVDALLDFAGTPAGTEAFSIPNESRLPRLAMVPYYIAVGAAYLDGVLYAHLAGDAWPRLLLNSIAQAMCGDMRSAAAGVKPVFVPGRVGPIGCLAFAYAARMAGNAMLAGLIAGAGEQACDAEGLALEARTLVGLAPALLPAIGATAEVLAAEEADPARADALRALAGTCSGSLAPALRLEAAARQAAALGACTVLKQLFSELRSAGGGRAGGAAQPPP